ncbi:extracellular solute-binding protein [Paenibacillus sp. J2TS4]|uniref:extracellular solute-binding protein n=1 Tax=Paenibacillus sp. J2TS4 TaxID=2807194 RepID=UPI001B104B36|nr:extracellular solute-binding protein [Paenibacillus sp. J2TS4]GIP34814.1 hypothetical protein J2TS4_40240 [Paenibacillus sp. J2TS4]
MSHKPSRTTFRARLDEMVRTLRNDIVSGKLSIGQYLPSERVLAIDFQLSKNSVRQGLDLLVSEGLIEKVPRIGNKVVQPYAAEKITVTFGYYPSVLREADLHGLLEDFHREHPHIDVRAVPLTFGNDHGVSLEYMENNLLDIFTLNNTDYQRIFEQDRLLQLEPLEADSEVYPFLSRLFTQTEDCYVRPFLFTPVILCYNREHFREKQVLEPDSSWTWDDAMEAAVRLSDGKDRYGFYFHLLSDNRWPVFLLQSGMKFERNEEGRYVIGGTKLMESLVHCRSLIYHQGIFPTFWSESDADAEQLFLSGKVSMIMTTYLSLNHMRQAKFDFDVAPLPYKNEARSLLVVIGLAVNRHSRHKEAAKVFVDYLLSYNAQLRIRKKTLSIPAHKRAAEWKGKESLKRPSRFHMYREIVPSYRLVSELNLSMDELATIRNELKWFWSNMEDEISVCRRLEAVL